ncbi:MAG: DUF2062 domain-containing protein [Bacteriovoracaceae bacterium]|nr:DUF2062 domain-containing protein [Bacteriovoracaceae bacterium]
MKLKKLKNWLYEKILRPLVDQLKQGVTPKTLAQSLAVGFLLGIFPIIGVSTFLCALIAYRFKLNPIAIQLANYVVYPLQFALLIPFYRAGEWLFQVEPIPLNIFSILEQFKINFWEALQMYGATGLRSVVVWAAIFPVLYFALSFCLKYFLQLVVDKMGSTNHE